MGEEKTLYGTVKAISEDAVTLDSKAVLWRGNQWEGDLPALGASGAFVVWVSDPKPGKKYGSKYLSEFRPGEAAPAGAASNGAQASYEDRQPLIQAEWAYNAAMVLAQLGAIAVTPSGTNSIPDVIHQVAKEFFFAAFDLVREQKRVEEPSSGADSP